MQQFQEPHTRLRFIRSLTGLTRLAIEEKYQLPEITLKKWETGKLSLSDKGIKKCLEIYKQENILTTHDWIKKGIGPLPTFATFNNSQDQDLLYFKNTYPNLLIHKVVDDEMMPKYNVGETVLGLIEDREFCCFHNLDCLIKLESGEIVFRKVVICNQSKINLVCINNFTEKNFILFDVHPTAIAPIFWHKISTFKT